VALANRALQSYATIITCVPTIAVTLLRGACSQIISFPAAMVMHAPLPIPVQAALATQALLSYATIITCVPTIAAAPLPGAYLPIILLLATTVMRARRTTRVPTVRAEVPRSYATITTFAPTIAAIYLPDACLRIIRRPAATITHAQTQIHARVGLVTRVQPSIATTTTFAPTIAAIHLPDARMSTILSRARATATHVQPTSAQAAVVPIRRLPLVPMVIAAVRRVVTTVTTATVRFKTI
jgi:hypothetical protein